jgi:hypothetical protein
MKINVSHFLKTNVRPALYKRYACNVAIMGIAARMRKLASTRLSRWITLDDCDNCQWTA